jgi:hypothetical protein
MKQTINLKGRDVLKIKRLAGVHNYDDASKMKGQKYHRYAFDGASFIANTEDNFVALQNDGKLYSADLELTMQGDKAVLSLLNYTSSIQEKEMAKTEAEMNYILNSFNPAKVDESLLNDLA